MSFLSNRRLQVALDGKLSQEYPVNARVPQSSILGTKLFLPYINELNNDVICNIAIYANDFALYSKRGQTSDLWQQLELASELAFDLRDIVNWGMKWLVYSNAGKTQLFCLTGPTTLMILMWKWMGLLLRKNHVLWCWVVFLF